MNITIELNDSEFSAEDKTLIQACLGLENGEVNGALVKLAKAAFLEYVKMFKEKGLPTRADEVLQERLFFLLKNYYEGTLPTENEISSIFQLTPSQSRTLLRNTKSRYRTKINDFIKETLRNTLATAERPDGEGDYEFVSHSASTVEELNLIVSQKGPDLQPVEKIRGRASKYKCSVDTYNLLNAELE